MLTFAVNAVAQAAAVASLAAEAELLDQVELVVAERSGITPLTAPPLTGLETRRPGGEIHLSLGVVNLVSDL